MIETISTHPYFLVGFPLLLFVSALVLLVLIYREIKKRPELDWLRPYAMQAIVAAFKMSELSVDKFGRRLFAEDKEAIAELAYTHLPPNVQAVVTRSQFATAVGYVFDEVVSLYARNQIALEQSFLDWQKAEEQADELGQPSFLAE